MISPDLLFSYWIFIWYILYKFKLIIYNPFILFCISTVVIIYSTIYSFYKNKDKNKIRNIIIYFIINFFIKIIPVIDLYNTKTTLNDIIFIIIIFIIYNIYIYIKGGYYITDMYGNKNSIDRVIYGQTPAVYYINKLFF